MLRGRAPGLPSPNPSSLRLIYVYMAKQWAVTRQANDRLLPFFLHFPEITVLLDAKIRSTN